MNTQILATVKRRYVEVFGDLEVEIKFLRVCVISLVSVIALCSVFLFQLGKKPPVVIRVSEVEGARGIENLHFNNNPTEPELIAFAKRFIFRYTAYNSYTLSKDMAEAMNMMSPAFQKRAKKELMDSGFLQKITDSGIDTELELKEGKIERDSKDSSVVSLVGVRRVTRYTDPDFKDEMIFRAEIVLNKVPRSMSVPEGLMVETYKEIIVNQISERK